MIDALATLPLRSGRVRRFSARLLNQPLPLLAALLICFSVACSKGGGGGDDDPAPAAAAAAPSGSGSGTSSGTGSPPSGGGESASGDSGSSSDSGNPQASGAPRTYSVRFLPSSSGGIQGYELLVGEASGSYDERYDIDLDDTDASVPGVLSYDIQLESDKDHFMVMRAYDDTSLSPFSNEIEVAALESSGARSAGVPSGGSAAHAAGTAAASITDARTEGSSSARDATRELAEDSSGTDDAESSEERERVSEELASLDFDGAGERLSSSYAAEIGTSDLFSVSMWARPIADDAPRRVLLDVRAEDGSDANRLTLAVVDSSDLELTLHGMAGTVLHRARFAEVLIDGVWQHLAVVFDAETDLEPRFFIDAELRAASESSSEEGSWALLDGVRRVFLGAEAGASDAASYLGQLGHAGIWADALSADAVHEISARGHAIDLRDASDAYDGSDSLLHYWRLGDDSNGVGFDYGQAGELLDLDDPDGGIDESDIVDDAPGAVMLAGQ